MVFEHEKELNKFWDLFDKLKSKQKVEWLLEFDIIFDTVKDWDIEELREQAEILRKMPMTKTELIEDKL